MISLSEAAGVAGVSKSTLLRAIKSGRLSAAKNELGSFQIDPAELFRVYPPASPGAPDTAPMTRHAPSHDATDALVAQLRQTIEDLRGDRDAWRDQAQRLALPRPESQQQAQRGLFGLFRRAG